MSVDELDRVQHVLQLGLALFNEATNARRAAVKLPPEILTHIFSMVPRDLPTHGTTRFSATQTYDLIPLTHVCRRWRDIALDASPLWSTVCETVPSHVASHILRARARQVPLTVYVDRPYPSAALRALLASEGKHVAKLELHDLHELSASQLSSGLLSFSAPSLQRLVVYSRAARVAPEQAREGAAHIVQLCGGEAPRLKHLEFHDVPFLPENKFAELIHLTLSYNDCPVGWELDDLLRLLADSPMLQHVRLNGLPCDLHEHRPPTAAPVPLPHLKMLEIGDCRGFLSPIPLLRLLLSYVVLSPDASVRIYGVEACRITGSVDLASEDWSDLAMDMTFSALTVVLSRPLSSATFCIQLSTGGTSTALLEQAVTALVRDNTGAALRNVTISSQRSWSSWCDPRVLLSALPSVEVLELRDCYLVPSLLDALRPSAAARPEECEALCRSLTSLRLPPSAASACSELLSYVLETRAAIGLPLQCPESSPAPSLPLFTQDTRPTGGAEFVDIFQLNQAVPTPAPVPYEDEIRIAGAAVPASTLSHLGYYFMADY
ncbi:hypothetical protein BN946_scf185042.g176 [Trametes cinnabarina]|uniref:F-box domain-containing protein n=1 Tax=Pycnoporus cinnabarinus TaxID=5643 RepID=A0A060SAG5_PYCCI|nr:hypothetical protein BN946_scf185042.g176 [Trametes cinnabarina]